MKTRLLLAICAVAFISAPVMFDPILSGPQAAPAISANPFVPVWSIMTRPAGFDSMGCRGCHIGPQPGFGPWFGDTPDDVRMTLETGIRPDGFDLGFIPVDGGRSSILGTVLHTCEMPFHGTCWGEDELALLDDWLITYE